MSKSIDLYAGDRSPFVFLLAGITVKVHFTGGSGPTSGPTSSSVTPMDPPDYPDFVAMDLAESGVSGLVDALESEPGRVVRLHLSGLPSEGSVVDMTEVLDAAQRAEVADVALAVSTPEAGAAEA